MSKNLSELSGRKPLDNNLFEELGKAAGQTGTPSAEKMEELAHEFIMGTANIYGSMSFYDFLRPENREKKVYLCNGSSCLTAGTQPALKENLLKHYQPEEIGEMCCLGRCHENSSFHVAGKNYSGKAIDEIEKIKFQQLNPRLSHLTSNISSPTSQISNLTDKYYTASKGTTILTSPFTNMDDYYKILQSALTKPPDELLNELKLSGLRGRGGAGFPIAFKIESAKNTTGKQKFIVCNADEGDPGAYSDRYLLEQQTHSVLSGMMIAGYIIGADKGVIYIRAEYPEAIEITQKAIDELRTKKITREHIFYSNFNFDFKIIAAQGAYICGEETALLSSIEGQRPEVRVRPPYPTQQGLFNKPTVVNNVETLACIPYIIKNGGEAFAKIGKARLNDGVGQGKSTGTKLVSLDGFFNKPGIYEVDMGTPLSIVINELGGGFKSKIKALHIGGPLGGIVPMNKINDLSIDFESFSQNGFLLGHASIVCIPEDFPMIRYIEHLFQFTAHESCGKCFPCRLGSTRGFELINKSLTEDYKIDKELFTDLLTTMEIGSLCALGGGLPLPIKNALMYFEEELKGYFIV